MVRRLYPASSGLPVKQGVAANRSLPVDLIRINAITEWTCSSTDWTDKRFGAPRRLCAVRRDRSWPCSRLVPQPALGTDLPHLNAGDIEVEYPCVAAVQLSETVQARLDLQEGPNLSIHEHHVTEVLADPDRTGDVAPRVKQGAVGI